MLESELEDLAEAHLAEGHSRTVCRGAALIERRDRLLKAARFRFDDNALLIRLDSEQSLAEPVHVLGLQPQKALDDGVVDVRLPIEPHPERQREVHT